MQRRTLLSLLAILIAASAIADPQGRRRSVGGSTPPLQYLVAYDSALRGNWSITRWDDADHLIEVDPAAVAPGRPGRAIEVRFSENGWGAFGLANMTDWSNVHYLYLNEFRTIELDLYIEPDSTGIENLHVVLEDAGASAEPRLVSYIDGWDPAHPERSTGRWIPVRIDLSQIGATVPRFMRFLFYNSGWPSRPHLRIANVRLGWLPDTTPPAFVSVTATPSLTYDRLTLAFTNDKATTYRIEYGAGNYDRIIEDDRLATSHTAVLTGLSRGNTYQYRISARTHHDPSSPPPPAGLYTGTYAMPAVPTSAPAISSFTATPSEIAAGESPRLRWSVADYDTLAIDQGVGSVANVAGSTGVLVRPAQTTTYTLTATNAIGSTTRTVTIITHPVPTVRSFTATPAKINAGGTAVLTWDIGDSERVTIDPAIGNVTSASVPVNPAETTTYVLTASNAYGTVRQTTTVTVDAPATNPIWVMGYYIGYHRGMQTPAQVDYSAMTHIILGPVIPNTDGTWQTHFYVGDVEGPAWARETVQRAHAAGIKAILMLGGAGSVDGFLATSNPTVRAAFVTNLKAIVEEYGFDGVDLDWEPLGPGDRTAAIALMQALQAPDALPRSRTIYTLPVGWNNSNWNNMADPFFGEIAAYFDRVTPMTYSMIWLGDGWESWHTGALYGETPNAPSSIHNTVQALRAAGVPAAKLGIGIGFYGDAVENGTWTSSGWAHLDPPAIPSYITGPHQNTDRGFWRYGDNTLSYSNIMRYLHSGTAYRWDATARVPYLSFSAATPVAIPGFTNDMRATFVTYDDERSIAEKGSYVRRNGLGGVMIWAISEGYLGSWKTSGELDPLMKAVVAAFR